MPQCGPWTCRYASCLSSVNHGHPVRPPRCTTWRSNTAKPHCVQRRPLSRRLARQSRSRPEILWGPVDDALIAESQSASLLCVGSVGIGWIARHVLGPPRPWCRKGHCPVVVVRKSTESRLTRSPSGSRSVSTGAQATNSWAAHALDEANPTCTLIAVAYGAVSSGTCPMTHSTTASRRGDSVPRLPHPPAGSARPLLGDGRALMAVSASRGHCKVFRRLDSDDPAPDPGDYEVVVFSPANSPTKSAICGSSQLTDTYRRVGAIADRARDRGCRARRI